jgi:hypothetical protein
MTKTIEDMKERIACSQIRQGIVALLCLTVIAIVAMARLTDPENIVINVIVGIGCFAGGVATERTRRTDQKGKEGLAP